jgi:hypothetical protein
MTRESRGKSPVGKGLGAVGTVIVLVIAAVMALRGRGPAQPSSEDARTASPRAEIAPERSEKAPAGGPDTRKSLEPPPRETRPESISPSKPAGAAAATTPASVRIGTWNIEWLGKPEQRSGAAKNTAQSPDDMADYIVASGVCVLAVEEIVAQAGSPPRSKELDAALAAVQRRTGDGWQYILFPGRGDGKGEDQLTGVAWNPKLVTPLNAQGKPLAPGDAGWRLPIASGRSSQGSGLWNRPPHAVQFSTGAGKTDFAVVVVHMKADYEGDFAAHRNEEAARLAEAIPAVAKAFKDQDVVVLGDTNMTKPNEPAKATIEGAKLVDLNRKAETTHWRGGATDRIFVPVDQPEFADRRFEVMSDRYLDPKRWDPKEFKRRLSDHYMAVTVIKVMPDDD